MQNSEGGTRVNIHNRERTAAERSRLSSGPTEAESRRSRPVLLFAFVAGGWQQPGDDRAHCRINAHERPGRASFEKILFSLRVG